MRPQDLRWVGLEQPIDGCDVASASAGPDGIVLSFGVREPGDAGDIRVRRLHQVVLDPQAAAGLRQMLGRLLADLETSR